MATGYSAQLSADVAKDHGTLYKPNVQLLAFISTSAGWIYPIDRFFGRALYEYYYNIETAAGQEDIQERFRILYKNYCNLVGSLLMSACMDFKIKTTEIVKTILLVETNPTVLGSFSERHYNYVRAAYGINHFIYVMMRYSNHFKLACCRDEAEIIKAKGSLSELADERRYLIYLMGVIDSIGESYTKTEYILSKRCLPVVDEISIGPDISSCGISLFNELQDQEYKSTITALRDANYQVKLTAHRLKQLDTMVEETSKEEVPPDLLDVIVALTRATTLDSDAPATISSPQPHLTKRTSSTRLSNEEVHLDLAPAKRGLFHKDILPLQTSPKSSRLSNEELHLDLPSAKHRLFQRETMAPPPSPKSKSHSPVESFKSSPDVKSKSHSPVEFFKFSPNVKSETHSPAEPFKSSFSAKSKSHSPARSSRSSTDSADQLSADFGEITISPLLAAELMQPSFEPIRYKAVNVVPACETGREEYLLGEYDRRLELHIVYHAMKYRTWIMNENVPSLKSIIDNQAMFEQTWPSPRSKNESLSIFSNTFTNIITDQGGTNSLLEVQSLIKLIQQTIDSCKIPDLEAGSSGLTM